MAIDIEDACTDPTIKWDIIQAWIVHNGIEYEIKPILYAPSTTITENVRGGYGNCALPNYRRNLQIIEARSRGEKE